MENIPHSRRWNHSVSTEYVVKEIPLVSADKVTVKIT
jgi:hypothetical protein